MKQIKQWMKKAILAGLFAAGISFSAGAQSVITIGPRAGANFSMLNGLNHAEMKTCFTGGAFILYSTRERFGWSADLLYTGRGAKYNLSSGGTMPTALDRKITLNYIELPVLANFFFMDRGSIWRPKVMVGPSLSYMLGSSQSGTGAVTSPDLNKFDVGIVGGLGINVKVATRMWLNVDARYTHNFLDINKNNVLGANDVHSRNIGVLLGLGFGIGE